MRRRVFLLVLSKLESAHQEINFREIRLKKKSAEFILKVTVCSEFAAVAVVDSKTP